MLVSSPKAPGRRHLKRNVAIAVAVLVVLSVSVVEVVGYVFGVTGCPGCPPNLAIISTTCSHASGECIMLVANRAVPPQGTITGAGPAANFTLNGGPVSVPYGGQASVTVLLSGVPTGHAATGYLTQADGPNLAFTAVVQ